MLIGDPGVGKTYYILQQLLYWRKIGIPAAVFFIEKRRRFYTMRFVAQLEGETGFLDFDWIKANPDRVRDALARHKPLLDALGRDIYSSDGQRVDLDGLLGWITQMASAGKRVIIVDPITAVAAGVERWTKDDDFVAAANDVAERHGASLVLVNHAKKGNRPGAPTGHDQSGGAAYYRFSDTDIWIAKPSKPRTVRMRHPMGHLILQPPLFFQIHKARNGKGTGAEIGYMFGGVDDDAGDPASLKFAEQGVVVEEIKT
jgi:hypothetical protein